MARQGGSSQKSMTLRSHLIELRNRSFLVAIILLVTSTLAYIFRDAIIGIMLSPLDGRQLQYLTPGGGFSFIFTVVIFAGIAATVPLILHQTYHFLSPVFSATIRKRGGWLVFWSFILLAVGVSFGYFFAVPGALNFLYGFADKYIVSSLTAVSYLDFVIKYTLGLGLLFQIPLIMIITHWITPLKPLKLLKFERWVILLAFILAAIITPTPDPVNQAMIAVPIIAVYQIGLIAVALNVRREKRRLRRAATTVQAAQPAPKVATPAQQAKPPVVAPAPAPTPAPTPPAVALASRPTRPLRSMDGVVPRRQLPVQRSRPVTLTSPSQRPQALTPASQAVSGTPRIPRGLSIDGIAPRALSRR